MTRKELNAKFRAEFPAKESFLLHFGGLVFEVIVNTKELKDDLTHYFKDFLTDSGTPELSVTALEAPDQLADIDYTIKEREPGKTKLKEEYHNMDDGRIVRKLTTGMVFVFGDGDNLAIGPCLKNSNQVINFINNRFIEYKLAQGCLLGHAAAVKLNGRGIAMAGFSGAGKSTLSLHVMSRGSIFVSNDRIMFEPREGQAPHMFGVAKHPRINPGTALNNKDLTQVMSDKEIKEFSALPLNKLWELEYKYDAIVSECFGPGKFELDGPMDMLVILNWKHDGSELHIKKVEADERHDLLHALMKGTGVFYMPEPGEDVTDPGVEEYVKGLKGCTIIEMSGGVDFDRAADYCMDFLKTGEIK